LSEVAKDKAVLALDPDAPTMPMITFATGFEGDSLQKSLQLNPILESNFHRLPVFPEAIGANRDGSGPVGVRLPHYRSPPGRTRPVNPWAGVRASHWSGNGFSIRLLG
jgi:hypothetical protein